MAVEHQTSRQLMTAVDASQRCARPGNNCVPVVLNMCGGRSLVIQTAMATSLNWMHSGAVSQ